MLKEKMKRRMSPWGASFGGGRSSESSAMASGPPDVMANQEAAEVAEECSGKKKSKFQTFKKFFARKKRKEPLATGADAALKGSQSTDNISRTSENNTLTQSEKDKGSGSKISLGSKALSHDSVFASDSSEANEALGASQDSIHGKVKSLQLQLKQAIRLGSPPSLMCVKRTEDMGTMSEDDGLPCSPPEYTTHTALAQVQGNSSISLEGTDSDEDQLSCAASSRAVSPLVVVPGDFSQPASPLACLDNSAAKHKLGLRHKACNKRRPATRLELKAEGDSVVEDILNSSISEAVEENNDQKVKDVTVDEFKPKEEEEEQAEHSRQSLLSDKEEREESSSEPEAEQDVSDRPDTSCPLEMGLSEEEATDARPCASSETGSGVSSVDSPRGTPEPPAGQREYLMDPPGIAYGTEEKRDQSDSVLGLTGGEDGEQEPEEEESSFLQEVLSSLKTPLNSPLEETESIVLEMEQEEVKNREEEKEEEEEEKKETETEEGEEEEEEEVDEEEPVIDQVVVSGSSVSDQNTKEEEEEVTTTTVSYNDAKEEMKHGEEEEEDDSTEEEEEEELVVEHFCQDHQVEELEKEDVEKIEAEEENGLHVAQTENQAEEEGEERKMEEEEEEEEEEAKELEQESEAKGEKQEKTVEDNNEDDVEVEEKNEEVEEPEEAKEDEKEELQENMFSVADGGEIVVDQEETAHDVSAVSKDETEYQKNGDKILPGQEEEVFDMVHDRQKAFDQMEPKEQNLDQEQDTAATEPNVEESRSEQDEKQESKEVSPQETKQEKEQSDVDMTVSSRPSSLTLPQIPTSPSKTSTIHINLVSPSAEKTAFCFQRPASTVEAKESMSTAEEPGDKVEKAEEEEEAKQPCDAATAINKEAKPSAPVDETSKVRFTITPAWQRSLSIGEKDSSTPPSSPPASVSSSSASGRTEVATTEEPLEKAESASSAKVELVLSPSRAKNAEVTTTKPQSPTPGKPQMEESSVVVEGNPNNPFGVRLRKTSALHRFSSEEENAEPVHESAPQPSSCTSDSPQPLSGKPSVSQPISNKPALPKKPEVAGDGGGKTKRILDPTAARGGSDPPSWISVAKQKQKVYKENSVDNTAVQKEEQERKSSLPVNSSSNKTPESSSRVSPLEFNKSSASVEKESRRSLSPPTPVPPQPAKSPSLPFPVPPKPHVTISTTPKPSPRRSLSPTTPVPVTQRPPSCTGPLSTSKPTPSLPTANMTLTSPPFSSSRTTPAQSTGSSPTPATQRGVPPPALTQDEPPWMALAKKKAKAWSEMPQIVQ